MIAVENVLTDTVREHADVVFPGEAYPEKEGTLTNVDGRVQRLRQAIGRPKGRSGLLGTGVRPIWQVITDVAQVCGTDLGVLSGPMASAQLFAAVPFYNGLTLDEIGGRGIRWPETAAGQVWRNPPHPPRRRRSTSRPPRRRPTAACGSALGAACGRPRRSTSRRC